MIALRLVPCAMAVSFLSPSVLTPSGSTWRETPVFSESSASAGVSARATISMLTV
jgi:hypothetical protein